MTPDKHRFKAKIAALPGLNEVETIIKARVGCAAPRLTEISSYLLGLGGKRIRPVLTLMAARALSRPDSSSFKEPAGSEQGQQLLDVAAGIELIHMATLLHDDIIDKSAMRRHKQSPFLKYGADETLLTGDFLLVRAFGLCARLDRFIIDATEAACVTLTEGEILEVNLTEARHNLFSSIDIARRKTAALFKLAAQTASHLAGADGQVIESMSAFGENLGIAFQIVDDILDVTADAKSLGKPAGQDLRERKPSVINVLWLESGSSLAQKLLAPHLADSEAFVSEALQEIKTAPLMDQAKALAHEYAERALTVLETAVKRHFESDPQAIDPESLADLRALAAYVLDRVS